MAIPDERRRLLQLDALEWIDAWGLLFAEKLTYEELWGERPRGLTRAEVVEIALAYEEWERLQGAIRAWEGAHDPRQESAFDVSGYLARRRAEILSEP